MELPAWKLGISAFRPALFIGLYHPLDWLAFLLHRGARTAVWCGGDVLAVQERPRWGRLLTRAKGVRHICENGVEQKALSQLGIGAEILPLIFTPFVFGESPFIPSTQPQVYLTAHPGREKEYGVPLLAAVAQLLPDFTFHIYGVRGAGTEPPNVQFHGAVGEGRFNEEIRRYHGAIRLNAFDGFAETLAKSALL